MTLHTRSWLAAFGLCCALGALPACGGSGEDGRDAAPDAVDAADADADVGTDGSADTEVGGDADGADEAGDDGGPSCPRVLGPADRVRKVVVSHPYDSGGGDSSAYEVLALATDGTLSRTAATFELSRALDGEIVFTPDGEVGVVAHEDGTIGAFRFDDTGMPVVIDAAFAGPFYASGVVMDPSGERVWVLDAEWRATSGDGGGGIYSVGIGCDGALADEGRVAPAKLPYTMDFLPGDPQRVFVAAYDILDVTTGPDAHLLRWGATPEVLARADAFPADDEIVSSTALTFDGHYALIADNGMFSDPNRIAVVAIDGDGLRAVGMVQPLDDPVSVVASPWNNAALVASGFGNAAEILSYDPADTVEPFVDDGEPIYVGVSPQLPGTAVQVERGALRGLVLLAEVSGVRRMQFESDGTVTDLGLTDFGDGYENMPGAIGVQP